MRGWASRELTHGLLQSDAAFGSPGDERQEGREVRSGAGEALQHTTMPPSAA